MKRSLIAIPCAFVLLVACKTNEAPKEDTVKSAAPTEMSDEELAKADVPVKEDFEAKAYASINEDNLEAQLDALEQEIDKDKE